MLQVLAIILAIAFSNAPPQTVPGNTQGPTMTTASICPVDPPENQGGGC